MWKREKPYNKAGSTKFGGGDLILVCKRYSPAQPSTAGLSCAGHPLGGRVEQPPLVGASRIPSLRVHSESSELCVADIYRKDLIKNK